MTLRKESQLPSVGQPIPVSARLISAENAMVAGNAEALLFPGFFLADPLKDKG